MIRGAPLFLVALVPACRTSHAAPAPQPQASAAVQVPPVLSVQDTARGIVAVVGTERDRRVVLRQGPTRPSITLAGPLATTIARAAGADVWVSGTRAGNTLTATAFLVRTVDGVPALDGTLVSADGQVALVTADHVRHVITNAPAALRQLVGARAWVTGDLAHGGVTWGVLVPPPAHAPVADSVVALDLSRGDSVRMHGFADGMARLLASDAVYLRAGAPVVSGTSNIRAMLAAARPVPAGAMRWQPLRVGVSSDGTLAYTAGIAATASSDSARVALRADRYIAVWRRDGAGWRIVAYAEIGAAPASTGPVSDTQLMAHPGSAVQDSIARVLVATDSAFSAHAARAGIADAFASYAAATAMTFSGSLVNTGPAEVRGSFAGAEQGTLEWHAVDAGAAASADLGFTVGVATYVASPGASPRRSKYLTVWALQRDGSWRYLVDGGNALPQ
ncbi:MAG TPA: nuclear transport factor 2 family protein [Gemmatimonadaceae bacterium]|nr:nuclear transport factor 2 family protein [Gemmatimonadaceae bacterium]